MCFLLIVTQVFKLIQKGGDYPEFKYVVLGILCGDVYTIVYYVLSKKYISLAMQFTNLTTIVLTIVCIEVELLTSVITLDGGGCAAIIALIVS